MVYASFTALTCNETRNRDKDEAKRDVGVDVEE